MIRIMTEPKNALLKQYQTIFAMDGIELVIDEGVKEEIVDTALRSKTGARGLRSICEKVMADAMFEAPSSGKKTFRVSVEYVKDKLKNSI